jgi:hypothetical protein
MFTLTRANTKQHPDIQTVAILGGFIVITMGRLIVMAISPPWDKALNIPSKG